MHACTIHRPKHELCFRSLSDPGHVYVFPCDVHGHVDLDGLSDLERNDYLFARVFVGRMYRAPVVEAVQ